MARNKTHIKNLPEFYDKMKRLSKIQRHDILLAAAKAGMQIIRNAALRHYTEKGIRKTGTLGRSLKIRQLESKNAYARVALGTNVKYAKRVEFGFEGADSLGRVYHQQAQPYLRPAFDEERDNAVDEVKANLESALDNLGVT